MPDRGGAHAPLIELTLARIREFLREPEAVFWVFVFPILMACALGVAFRSRSDQAIVVGILNVPGHEVVESALRRSGGFDPRLIDSAQVALALQRADVQLVIEPGSTLVYRFDPTRAESRAARQAVDDALQRAQGRKDVFVAKDVHVETVGSRYIDWLVPGLLGMNIMSTGLWGLGFSIVSARTRKLLKRLVASPMRRRDFLLAQVLGRLVFLLLEVGALLGFSTLVFGVPVRGSLALLIACCVIGALAFGGIGLLVASRARTVEAVSGLLNLVMLPMWLLSGVFFASSNFPEAMQPFIRVLPLTALNESLRSVMLEGSAAAVVAPHLGLLAVWGLLSFVVALRIFRWR